MKSFVSTLSALAIALFLVGCGGPADSDAGPVVEGDGHAEAEAGVEGETAHAEEGAEGEAAPAEGEGEAPAEGEAAPAEGEAAPAEGEKAAE
jgi:hypothetical protein